MEVRGRLISELAIACLPRDRAGLLHGLSILSSPAVAKEIGFLALHNLFSSGFSRAVS